MNDQASEQNVVTSTSKIPTLLTIEAPPVIKTRTYFQSIIDTRNKPPGYSFQHEGERIYCRTCNGCDHHESLIQFIQEVTKAALPSFKSEIHIIGNTIFSKITPLKVTPQLN